MRIIYGTNNISYIGRIFAGSYRKYCLHCGRSWTWFIFMEWIWVKFKPTFYSQLLTIFSHRVNYLDIAPQHASVMHGISNTIATISGIVSPTLTGYIVQNKLPSEWQNVFYIAAGIYFTGSLLYWFGSSGKLQSWAVVKKNESPIGTSDNKSGYTNQGGDFTEIKL